MDDHERVGPTEAAIMEDPRLPVPLGDRRPALNPSSESPADPAAALVRVVAAAPLMTAAAVGAAAMSAAMTASRLLWPWLTGRGSSPEPPASASWPGPGLHFSYTHIELRWPLGR